MQLAALIAAIEAAIAAAPKIVAIAEKGKEMITALFTGGHITAQQQNALHARVDQVQSAFLAGEVPPAFTVEADPESPVAAPAVAATESAEAPVGESDSGPGAGS